MPARVRTFIVVSALLLIGPPAAARAALTSPPPSDAFGAAPVLTPNVGWSSSTADFTTEAGERYTSPSSLCQNVQMDRTAWYRVIGTGGTIVINAKTTNYDTVLGVYGPNTPSSLSCNDDVGGALDRTSLVRFASQPGATYWAQFGRCASTGCISSSTSDLVAVALTNDYRSDAVPVINDTQTTFGAVTDAGETTMCNGTSYNSTVWFTWTAPSPGHVTFTATSPGTGMATSIYRAASATPTTCGVSGSGFQPAAAGVDVVAGEALTLQVGTTGGQANFILSSAFVENTDVDADGYSRPADCNDGDRSIHPNAAEVPYDGIDQDCSGADLVDADHDGHAKAPIGDDCNDNDPAIHRGAHEISGNRVDEDCNGVATPGRLSPTPDVAFGSVARTSGRLFGVLTVTGLRRGERVTVSCSGGGCPRHGRRVSRAALRGSLTIKVYNNRVLAPGASVRISVRPASGNLYGWFKQYDVRRPRSLRKKTCQLTASGKRFGCRAG